MSAFFSLIQKLLTAGFLLVLVGLLVAGVFRKLLQTPDHESVPWHLVKNENTEDAYNEYLRECPNCAHVEEAEASLDALQHVRGLIARINREHLSEREDLVATTFSPDGQTLVAAGSDRLYFWDAQTGKQQAHSAGSFAIGADRRVVSLRYSLGGRQIAAGTANRGEGHLMVWDSKSGELEADHYLEGYNIRAVAFGPKGVGIGWLADGPVGIWEPHSEKIMRATHEGATAFSFLRNDQDQLQLLTAAGREVWLWDPATLEPLNKSEIKTEKELLGISRDGQTILYQDRHGLEIWNPLNGTLLAGLERLDSNISAFCRESHTGWVALGSEGGELYLWDPKTNKILARITAHRSAIDELACSSRGRIASRGLDSTKIWDMVKMKKSYSPHQD